ncbi:MAG: rhodanese-like domain-containing protein [Polyangiales bacterium]
MDHSPRFLRLVDDAKTRVKEISVDEVRQKLARGDAFDLVDVREESEWAAGHAKGARYLGRGILERDLEKTIPDPDREVVLYCGGGFRSALSADSLAKMGYGRVLSLAGGFKAWRDAGGAIEK